MEEVFLKVGSEDLNFNTNFNEMRIQEIDLEDKEDEEFKEAHEFSVADQKLTINFFANIKAMCYKRSILERRRWRLVLFSEIIIPVLFVLIGIWIT